MAPREMLSNKLFLKNIFKPRPPPPAHISDFPETAIVYKGLVSIITTRIFPVIFPPLLSLPVGNTQTALSGSVTLCSSLRSSPPGRVLASAPQLIIAFTLHLLLKSTHTYILF